MKKNLLFHYLLALLLLPAFACSDDDDMPEIDNLTTLNMLDAENGATLLGNSDIYINEAYNFETRSCLIAEIGSSSSIGKIIPPKINNGLVQQTAVKPGYLYQAFIGDALKQFPSGKSALAVNGDYYQFYVESELMKEEKRVGAVVRFALLSPETNGLPEYGTCIGAFQQYTDGELTFDFPKNTELVYPEGFEDCFLIEYEKGTLRLTYRRASLPMSYEIYARNETVYTKVTVDVVP